MGIAAKLQLAVFAALAIFAAGCGGGSSKPPTSTANASVPPPTAAALENTSTPTPVTSDSGTSWKLGAPIRLGSDPGQLNLALYIEQGCSQCDGPPTTLERVSRNASGEVRRDILFKTPAGSKYMTSTAVATDGTLYATACFGDCYEVGSGIEGNGYAIVYTSKDDGKTWVEEPRTSFARKVWGRTALPSGEALLLKATGAPLVRTFEAFPSGKQFPAPVPDAYPIVTADPNEPVLWQTYGGPILRPDGSVVPLPLIRPLDFSPVQSAGAQPAGGLVLLWGEGDQQRPILHNGVVREGQFASNYAVARAVGFVAVGAWLDDHRALGEIDYSIPALIDFATGEVRPIEIYGPIEDLTKFRETYPGRNHIIGFARP